jgi:hypothetical protein
MKREVVTGMIGGLAGGMGMAGIMMLGKRAGFIEEPVPLQVERWAEDRLRVQDRLGPRQEMAAGMGGHLAFSAAMGGVYGVLRSALNLPALPTGPLYGLGLYAVNMLVVGPALGVTERPAKERPPVVGRQLMMHTMYGVVTALAAKRLRDAMR